MRSDALYHRRVKVAMETNDLSTTVHDTGTCYGYTSFHVADLHMYLDDGFMVRRPRRAEVWIGRSWKVSKP